MINIFRLILLIGISVLEVCFVFNNTSTLSKVYIPFWGTVSVSQSYTFVLIFLLGLLGAAMLYSIILETTKKEINKLNWDRDKSDVTAQEHKDKVSVLENKIKTLEEALESSLKAKS